MTNERSKRWQRFLLVALSIVSLSVIAGVALRRFRTPTPRPMMLELADGTQLYYLSDTNIVPNPSYPAVREIQIDGEAFIRATDQAPPLVIRTQMLALKIQGNAGVRVDASSQKPGQEADVLYGRVEATKAYPSPHGETDTLLAGEEVLVSQTVDLQTKAPTDLARLRAWSDALMASVGNKGMPHPTPTR